MPTQIFKWELESIFYLTGKFGEKIGMMQTLPLKLLTVILLHMRQHCRQVDSSHKYFISVL